MPFGGAAGSGVDAAILIEEWASHSPDFVISMAGPLIALVPVYQVGTPEQIQRFVAPFLADSGTPVAAMAYSEPAGSANFDAPPPAEGTRTTAVPDGDDYVVNGSKAWASHLPGWDGDGPDVMTIVCRAPGGVSLLVAEREHLAGHIEVEKLYDLPGLRGCLTAQVRLRDVRVPRANLLGAEGQGVELTRNAFIGSGASIGTFAVAAMRQAFDVAYRFATTERRGGAVPIIEHQAVSDVLANAKARIEAVRLLSWRALDAALSRRPAGARVGAARQGVRLRDRGRGDQRPGPGGRRLRLRHRLPAVAPPPRGAGLPGHRGLQHRRPPPPDAGPAHLRRLQPPRRIGHGLTGAQPSVARRVSCRPSPARPSTGASRP